MKALALMILIPAAVCAGPIERPGDMPPERADRPHTVTGDVFTFKMSVPQLGPEPRKVWVYLPPDYNSSGRSYPVLYLQDGQNLFDAATSFSGEWGVDEALERLFSEGAGGIIAVGVENGRAARLEEYTPWPHPEHGGGRGAQYAEFLAGELKPLIDRSLRTLPGPENTAVGGSSLGGLISLYTACAYPRVFGLTAAFSPSVWFSKTELLDHIARPRDMAGTRFYVDTGTQEGEEPAARVQDARDAADALRRSGAKVELVVEEGAGHNEAAWARRFPGAVRRLFGLAGSRN